MKHSVIVRNISILKVKNVLYALVSLKNVKCVFKINASTVKNIICLSINNRIVFTVIVQINNVTNVNVRMVYSNVYNVKNIVNQFMEQTIISVSILAKNLIKLKKTYVLNV